MFPQDSLAGLILVFAACALAYRSSFLHNRRFLHLSLLQIIYLIIAPGALFLILYSYIQQIIELPSAPTSFISDAILVRATLLSLFLAYGGTAIHSVTKMLSETSLRLDHSEVGRLNRYFHLNFSHNLVIIGAFFAMGGLVLLELNHIPDFSYNSWVRPVIIGGIVGGLTLFYMYTYTHSKDQYVGRWADFKASFLVAWILLLVIFSGIRRINPSLRQYQLLIPMLLALGIILLFNLMLVARRLKNRHRPAPSRE